MGLQLVFGGKVVRAGLDNGEAVGLPILGLWGRRGIMGSGE